MGTLWRTDYQIATPDIAAAGRQALVFKAQRFSDHAPLTVDTTGKHDQCHCAGQVKALA